MGLLRNFNAFSYICFHEANHAFLCISYSTGKSFSPVPPRETQSFSVSPSEGLFLVTSFKDLNPDPNENLVCEKDQLRECDHTWFKAAGRNDEETSIIVTYTVIVTACAASFVIIAIVRTFHLIESYIQIPLLFHIFPKAQVTSNKNAHNF